MTNEEFIELALTETRRAREATGGSVIAVYVSSDGLVVLNGAVGCHEELCDIIHSGLTSALTSLCKAIGGVHVIKDGMPPAAKA